MEEVEKLLKKFGITFDKEARKFIDLIVEKITNGTETVKAVEEVIKESSFHNNMKAEMIATILLCSVSSVVLTIPTGLFRAIKTKSSSSRTSIS